MEHLSTPFGENLRKRRLEAGLSLTDLSGLVHYSKAQLSKVERGIKTPSRDLARLCDAVLGADGALIALNTPTAVGSPAVSASGPVEEENWMMQLSPDGPNSFGPMGRREVMHAGGAALMTWRSNGSSPPSPAAGAGMLDASRLLFTHYRRLGQAVEPGLLLPVLIAQTHTLRELSAQSDSGTRRRLLTLGSRYAEYVGWLVQETGDERAALWWTQRAVDLAAAGGDQALAGYALVRRALVTLYREDAEQTIALARRAQSDVLPSRIRGLAAQREAQGHALAGDLSACLRALDRARSLLARHHDGGDGLVIGPMHLPDSVGMVTGWCLVDLGRPREASEELDRQLTQIGPDAVRTRTRYGVRRALAYASAGEIDQACALTEQLLDGVAAVRSATITTDLRRLARVLGRYPDHPPVRRLAPRLGTLSRPITPCGGVTIMSEIFINYRTGDGEKTAALLRQGLSHRFGPGHAFHASQSIVPGESWPGRLLTAVRRSSVLLAVIGPRWTHFRAQLERPGDWVRREIEEAFECEVPVVPVLDGRKTSRLSKADLPPALRRLADLQSLAFDSGDTDVCVARIGDLMADLIPGLEDQSGTEAGTPSPGSVNNSVETVSGTAVQSRDFTGDVGTVIKDARGPVHTGTGNNYVHSRHVSGDRHFSGDGMTYFEGDHHGAIQHRFGERAGHEDEER